MHLGKVLNKQALVLKKKFDESGGKFRYKVKKPRVKKAAPAVDVPAAVNGGGGDAAAASSSDSTKKSSGGMDLDEQPSVSTTPIEPPSAPPMLPPPVDVPPTTEMPPLMPIVVTQEPQMTPQVDVTAKSSSSSSTVTTVPAVEAADIFTVATGMLVPFNQDRQPEDKIARSNDRFIKGPALLVFVFRTKYIQTLEDIEASNDDDVSGDPIISTIVVKNRGFITLKGFAGFANKAYEKSNKMDGEIQKITGVKFYDDVDRDSVNIFYLFIYYIDIYNNCVYF